ncbi:MAG: alpha/beta hydrolase-fold protein [Siphonobacter sp.]
MTRMYSKRFSPRLNRDMELLIFGHAGTRVLVFPTRRGRFYEYEDMGLINVLADKIENGWLQLFCVDSIDAESLYDRSLLPEQRILKHIEYEHYILEEVLPFTEQENPDPYLIVHGCSFGAFHAMNIGLRHPDVFNKIVAFSGRYDLSMPVSWFRDLFDGYYDKNIYYHTPNHFLPLLDDEQILASLRQLEIVFTIGEDDPFLDSNLKLAYTLSEKKIPYQLFIWGGIAHQAEDWQRMVDIYL